MAFCIFFQQKKFTAREFSAIETENKVAKQVQNLLHSWENDLPFTFHSSGSTGKAKAYSFSKEEVQISAGANIKVLNLQAAREHALLCIDPKFVGGAMVLIRALVLNSPITLMEPSLSIFEQIDSNHPFTFASFIPPQLSNPSFDSEKYQRIKHVLIGGAHIPEPLEKNLGLYRNASWHTYGMTETLSHVALKRIGSDRGYRVIEPYRIRLDENNCIQVSGGFLTGELSTHDVGEYVDEKQFIVKGRTDFIINSGGIKINPEEIERLIYQLFPETPPNSFVLAKSSHPVWGSELVLVFKGNGSEEKWEDWKKSLGKWINKHKLPKRYLLIPEFPLTESGKTDRLKLNEWVDNQKV